MDAWSEYKYNQAKAWLEYVRKLGRSAERTRLIVEDERAQLENVRGVDYTREHVSGSTGLADVDALIESLHRNIRDYCATEAAYVRERKDAYDRLARLENAVERDALTLRYVMGMPWKDVCEELGYSKSRMMVLRKSAIANAYDVMPREWRDPIPPAL